MKPIKDSKLTLFLLVLLLTCSGANTSNAATAANAEIRIEAEGNVDYDIEQNITTASRKVKLTGSEVTLETEELIYNSTTGAVKAWGGAKLTTKTASYQTDSLTYNLKEGAGSLETFTGQIFGKARDYRISGTHLELKANQNGIITTPTVTRCSRPRPDYLLVARVVTFTGNLVHLERVKLLLKGIPVFYLPSLNFRIDERNFPKIDAGYDKEDGARIKIETTAPINEQYDWRFRGALATEGESHLGMGVGYDWGRIENQLDLLYYFDNFWTIEEHWDYNGELFRLNLDLIREFSDQDQVELGLNFTRKYWPTPIGRWQVGILARQVTAEDELGDYGGTYGGYRLDYNPHPNLVLSYLWIESFVGEPADYRGDLLLDYQLGGNLLYKWQIPLRKEYSVGLDGAFNYGEFGWMHRVYRLIKVGDCFTTSIGWDQIEHSWEFGWQLKF